jgi:hypothetical protein
MTSGKHKQRERKGKNRPITKPNNDTINTALICGGADGDGFGRARAAAAAAAAAVRMGEVGVRRKYKKNQKWSEYGLH